MFNSTVDAVMDELAKVADGETKIEMIHYMNRVTLDVIGKVHCNRTSEIRSGTQTLTPPIP